MRIQGIPLPGVSRVVIDGEDVTGACIALDTDEHWVRVAVGDSKTDPIRHDPIHGGIIVPTKILHAEADMTVEMDDERIVTWTRRRVLPVWPWSRWGGDG